MYSNQARVQQVLVSPDSGTAWAVFDNSAFVPYRDYYVICFGLYPLKAGATLRITGFLHRCLLSPDGKRLMIHEGGTHHERIRLFDAKGLFELPVTKSP